MIFKIMGFLGRIVTASIAVIFLVIAVPSGLRQFRAVTEIALKGPAQAGYQHMARSSVIGTGSREQWIGAGKSRQRIIDTSISSNQDGHEIKGHIVGQLPETDFWLVPSDLPQSARAKELTPYIGDLLPVWVVTAHPFASALWHMAGTLIIVVFGLVAAAAAIFWKQATQTD